MKYAIGLDIGGTKIKGVLVTEKGKILQKIRRPTEAKKSKKIILENISSIIKKLIDYSKSKKIKIEGIGVGVPGVVPIKSKKLGLIQNIKKLTSFNLEGYLKKKFKKKIIVENDANCFALAEALFGAGKNKKIVIGLIWGSGLGGGIIINKKIHKGATGIAGEPGMMIYDPKSKFKSGSGNHGDAESFIGGLSLLKNYKLLKGKNKEPTPRYILKSKDPIARKVASQALYYLSTTFSHIVLLLNPDLIVIGGGVSYHPDYAKLNTLTKKLLVKDFRNTFKIVKHKIGDDAGVLGAASLIFQNN